MCARTHTNTIQIILINSLWITALTPNSVVQVNRRKNKQTGTIKSEIVQGVGVFLLQSLWSSSKCFFFITIFRDLHFKNNLVKLRVKWCLMSSLCWQMHSRKGKRSSAVPDPRLYFPSSHTFSTGPKYYFTRWSQVSTTTVNKSHKILHVSLPAC